MSLLLLVLACVGSVEERAGSDTGAADPPEALVSGLHSYALVVDWEGIPLTDGARCWETDQEYTVCLSEAWVSTTNLELVPCEQAPLEDTGWSALFLGRSAAAHSGHTHDVSQITPDLLEELVGGEGVALGLSPGSGGAYCELYQIMGPTSEVGIVSRLAGWYRLPGSEETVGFVAENTVSVTALPEVGAGSWAELGSADAAVSLVRFPARSLDGIEIESLSALDLAYSFAWSLGFTSEIRWQLDTP